MSDQTEAVLPLVTVKDAVRGAKAYLTDLLIEEGITNLGLEEIEHDRKQGVWLVTLGFSRPWNVTNNAITALTGEKSARRTYRVLKVRDTDGEILSVTKRDESD